MSQEMQQRQMMPPVFAGATGGVGTSVLARAIGGVDSGRHNGADLVHLLVCRPAMDLLYATEVLLERYARTQAALGQPVRPPVLAVVADLPRNAVNHTAQARLRIMEPNTSGIVHVPFVAKARETDFVDALLARCRDDQPPRELIAFTRAMKQIIAKVEPLLASDPAPAPLHPAQPHPAPFHPAPFHSAPFHPAPFHPAPFQAAPFQAAPFHHAPPLPQPMAPVPVAYPYPTPARAR